VLLPGRRRTAAWYPVVPPICASEEGGGARRHAGWAMPISQASMAGMVASRRWATAGCFDLGGAVQLGSGRSESVEEKAITDEEKCSIFD
jgi:hypothetical protein